jgi:hypothetical protein
MSNDDQNRPESALVIARTRVGEAIVAHARAIGILDLPADRLASMIEHTVKLLEGLSPSELSNLSPSNGQLVTAVATSFNIVYGQLSEGQLRAMRQGIDPGNAAAVQAFLSGGLQGAMFGSGAAGLPGGRANYRAALDGVDGVSPQKMVSYSAQYGDLGIGTGTIALFAKVDLDRGSYDAFTKEGYSRAAIKDAASDTNALGWKGADAVDDTIHAPDALRNAAIAAVNATTDADRTAREQKLEAVYEGLTPEQKEQAAPFLRRLNATHVIDAANAPEVARATSDADLRATSKVEGTAILNAATAPSVIRAAGQSITASEADVDAMFGQAQPKPAVAARSVASPGPH